MLSRALVGLLFLFAVAAPHSIAATQFAWLLGMLVWVVRLALVRPRPKLFRTPVDYALLGFFILTFFSALFSYEPLVSIGKLRAASLFTVVYLVAQNVASRRVARALALTLVASCLVSVVYTFGVYAVGRGVKIEELSAESSLRAAGVRAGDTVLDVDGASVRDIEDVARALTSPPAAIDRGGALTTVSPPAQVARVRVYRVEALPVFEVARVAPTGAADATAARLGITRWSRGRDERASGFYGHYVTYAEVLQLVASLAFGLLVACRARERKFSWRASLLAASVAGMCVALLLTVTRGAWLGFLISALVVVVVSAGALSRRMVLISVLVAVPLVGAGLFVLQQKRQVGFLDRKDGSTAWRLMVYRESLELLVREPRHMLVGVGMDSLKKRYREFKLFDEGRQNWSHLHSTPLQIAVERGLPTLFAWLALVFLYARTLLRLAARGRRRLVGGESENGGAWESVSWIEHGVALGALGGLAGFLVSGLVHWNLGDSEVAMVFYFIMGLALAVERLSRNANDEAKLAGQR